MGCGPSRPINRRPGLNLPADCSGSYCDIAINDISDVNIISLIPDGLRKRISAELALMDVDTLNRFKTLVDPSTLMRSTAKFGVTYSKIINFINNNGSNITDAQVNLFMDAAGSSSQGPGFVGVMFLNMVERYYYTESPPAQPFPPVPADISAWYSRYVEMLYRELTKTPAHTPMQLNAAVLQWIFTNIPPVSLSVPPSVPPSVLPSEVPIPLSDSPPVPPSDVPIAINSPPELFRNQNGNSLLQNVINNVGNNMRNKRVSGFSDFKPYDGAFVKHRFNNGFHPF